MGKLPPAAAFTFKARTAEPRCGLRRLHAARLRLRSAACTLGLGLRTRRALIRRAAPQGCPLTGADVARRASGAPLAPPDGARYRLEAPAGGEAADPAAWAAAVGNAKAQLEHQALRVQNLELLAKHGASAWLAHTRGLDAALAAAARELAALDAAAAELHKTRKVQQQAAGAELGKLQRQWCAAVDKNAEIAAACDALEAQAATAGDAGGAAAADAGGDAEMAA
jgi:pre-mRNA-splicing factor SPF27